MSVRSTVSVLNGCSAEPKVRALCQSPLSLKSKPGNLQSPLKHFLAAGNSWLAWGNITSRLVFWRIVFRDGQTPPRDLLGMGWSGEIANSPFRASFHSEPTQDERTQTIEVAQSSYMKNPSNRSNLGSPGLSQALLVAARGSPHHRPPVHSEGGGPQGQPRNGHRAQGHGQLGNKEEHRILTVNLPCLGVRRPG